MTPTTIRRGLRLLEAMRRGARVSTPDGRIWGLDEDGDFVLISRDSIVAVDDGLSVVLQILAEVTSDDYAQALMSTLPNQSAKTTVMVLRRATDDSRALDEDALCAKAADMVAQGWAKINNRHVRVYAADVIPEGVVAVVDASDLPHVRHLMN